MNENLVFLPQPLGAQLRQLRKRKYLTLNELAEMAGTSPSAVHRYESGWGRFELRTLRQMATALGARLVVLLEPIRDSSSRRSEIVSELVHRWHPLFWDLDLEAQHLELYPQWVLRRVLRFGDWDAVHQARRFFGDDAVRRAAEHRSMDARTRRFWRLVLGPAAGAP